MKIQLLTFGCQMNVYDSEVATGILKHAGYEIVSKNGDSPQMEKQEQSPFSAHGAPDIILMNTCSVREHAEERVYGRIGRIGKEKKENPNLIVGLMGCMVEEHKDKLFKRFPELDFMIGTRNIKELPSVIDEVRRTRKQVSKIKQDGISIEYSEQIDRSSPFHAWLPIMTGCDKECTYCIVPTTRGREVSMPAREVYLEASRLVNEGVKWITLLGQNVNSYNGGESAQLKPEHVRRGGYSTFPELLESLCEIKEIERISFTTSHPHDATEELFQVMAKHPKISRRFHLPLQSGSDAVLKRMARLHTYEDFKKKIMRLRELVPDVSVTSDIIVGFSGESEADYQATVRALEEIRFDSAFIYKYSLRPGTPAAKLPDDVELPLKERRNRELLGIQKKITKENNEACIGQTVDVFIESVSTKDPNNLIGRTIQDKKVVLPGSGELIGTFRKVKLENLRHETFVGCLVYP